MTKTIDNLHDIIGENALTKWNWLVCFCLNIH